MFSEGVSSFRISLFWQKGGGWFPAAAPEQERQEHLWKTQMQTESTLEDMETQRGVYQAGNLKRHSISIFNHDKVILFEKNTSGSKEK